jgi:O-antigen/teichoic acid export membrane protein
MINTAITSLLGFFFWMVVARFYTEGEVGYSSAIISAIGLLAMISMAGLNSSLIRFLPQAKKPQDLINSCLTISGLFSVVISIIFIVGLDAWSPALAFIKENIIFSLAFIIFTCLWTVSSLLNAVFIARRRAGFVLSKSSIFTALKIPLPILFASYWHSFGVVASWGISLAVALAIALLLFLPKIQASYKPVPGLHMGIIKDLWRYSSGSYIANLLSTSLRFILPLLVVNLISAEQNAYFYIGWMIASLLFAIPQSVSQSLFAEGSHFEDKLRENVVKSLKFSFLLMIPSIIVIILAGKWLLLAFGHSYSLNALNLLWVLSLSGLPVIINRIYSSMIRVEGKLNELILLWACIVFSVLLASYFIVPFIGITGIGYAWLGTHTVVAIYIIASKKLLPKK